MTSTIRFLIARPAVFELDDALLIQFSFPPTTGPGSVIEMRGDIFNTLIVCPAVSGAMPDVRLRSTASAII